MGKVTVSQFRIYDITRDDARVPRRWGTREGIERLCGEAMDETGVEVDESVVGKEVAGLTERDFNPNPRTGFQTRVSS